MTPKEKAKELTNELFERSLSYYDACIAAGFLVEEILKVIPLNRQWKDKTMMIMEAYGDNPSEFELPYSDEFIFWQEVKAEIEKL